MSNQARYKAMTNISLAEEILGVLTLSTGNDPTISAGAGFTATSDNAGKITVTLTDPYPDQSAYVDCKILNGSTTSTARAFPFSQSPSTGVFVFCLQSAAGTAADLDAMELHFRIVAGAAG